MYDRVVFSIPVSNIINVLLSIHLYHFVYKTHYESITKEWGVGWNREEVGDFCRLINQPLLVIIKNLMCADVLCALFMNFIFKTFIQLIQAV